MPHTVDVSDDDFLRLKWAAQVAGKTPEEFLADLIRDLPLPDETPEALENLERRGWGSRMKLTPPRMVLFSLLMAGAAFLASFLAVLGSGTGNSVVAAEFGAGTALLAFLLTLLGLFLLQGSPLT